MGAAANSGVLLVYRGEWYTRSLAIVEHQTFGGMPAVVEQQLIDANSPDQLRVKKEQKAYGGDAPKEILNEWTTDHSLARSYGDNFVIFIGLIGRDNPKVIYPGAETEGKEEGVLADSRMRMLAVAILQMNPKPNYREKNEKKA